MTDKELQILLLAVARTLQKARHEGIPEGRQDILNFRDEMLMELLDNDNPHSIEAFEPLMAGNGLYDQMREFIATGKAWQS